MICNLNSQQKFESIKIWVLDDLKKFWKKMNYIKE